ncbi:MAG TPA: hypothetical protein VI248_06220 [Kineosporiaceae bacterium]
MSITVAEQDRMAARLAEIRPFVDERAWRLLLGAEARAIGYGGKKLVAAAAKVKADTVARGVRELESGVVPDGRIRAVGAGRPRLRRWPIRAWCRRRRIATRLRGRRGRPTDPEYKVRNLLRRNREDRPRMPQPRSTSMTQLW